jgi:hypothetical protein
MGENFRDLQVIAGLIYQDFSNFIKIFVAEVRLHKMMLEKYQCYHKIPF